MATEHWFDDFHRAALRAATRREITRSLSVILPGLLLGGLPSVVAGKKNGKGKRKGKGKGKGKEKRNPASPPSPPAPDICDSTWPDAHNREYCRFIRRQCVGDDPRDFCIVNDFDTGLEDPVAVCCPEVSPKCCGRDCCDSDANCCDGKCCGSVADGFQCCNGRCHNTKLDPGNCGVCGNACDAGQVCFRGQCGCGQTCPHGQICMHGDGSLCVEFPNRPDCHCGCPPGFKYCPDYFGEGKGACVSERQTECVAVQ